ncbi:MAG: cell division transport system permease protein [Candidatus Atribacteria bacterium]|nr:cell division transport system permease protein [Candidatus Atribacteria bacterium]
MKSVSVRKRPYLFLMGFLGIFFTLLLVNFFLFGYLEIKEVGISWGETFTVRAYFKPEFSLSEAEEIISQVKQVPGVAGVTFVSPEEARERFLSYFQLGEEEIPVNANPFPGSLEIYCENIEDVPICASQVNEIGVFEEVLYGGEDFETLLDLYHFFLITGLLALAVVLLFSLIVIVAITRLAIQSQTEEIRVLHLMGATEQFIRTPFLREGFVQGGLAGLAALIVSLIVAQFALDFLPQTFSFFPWIEWSELLLPWAIVDLLGGGLVGLFGAYVACNQVLRGALQG